MQAFVNFGFMQNLGTYCLTCINWRHCLKFLHIVVKPKSAANQDWNPSYQAASKMSTSLAPIPIIGI
jgi:hypothetical protein